MELDIGATTLSQICCENRNPYQILCAYIFRKYKVDISDVTMSVPNTFYIEDRVLLPYHEAMNIFMDGAQMEVMVDMGQTLIIIASFTRHCLFWVLVIMILIILLYMPPIMRVQNLWTVILCHIFLLDIMWHILCSMFKSLSWKINVITKRWREWLVKTLRSQSITVEK